VNIVAKKTSPCDCGAWAHPGDAITWDPETRRTTRCPACSDECPDPEAHPMATWASDEDYPIFHDKW
jgi:hypothetical protein